MTKKTEKSIEKSFEELNISRTKGGVPSNSRIIKHYLCSLIVYGIGIFILLTNNWYSGILTGYVGNMPIKEFFKLLYLVYLVTALPIYLIFKPKSINSSNNIIIIEYFSRIAKKIFNRTEGSFIPDYRERQAILLFMVKLFFGPQMVQYSLEGIRNMSAQSGQISYAITAAISAHSLSPIIFPDRQYADTLYYFMINLLFFIDTAFFAFGYLTETSFFGNKIRQVEDSLSGIVICLICYPPFSTATTSILGWYQNNSALYNNDISSPITIVFRILALVALTIYTCASIALFTKASNLTNRGTVSIFPYNIIRHPAYLSKNLFWLLTAAPYFITSAINFSVGYSSSLTAIILAVLSLLSWAFIYFLRALAEERMLMRDPDYQEYAQRVKYRFIPGIW